MSSKFLEFSPPASASIKAGTPVIAIETGFFMQLPYPQNLSALQDCEESLWRRGSVPCCLAIIDGKMKVGLTKSDLEKLCTCNTVCSRSDLPEIIGCKGTAAVSASAALVIAKMAGIFSLVSLGLSDSPADLDALCQYNRLVFSNRVSRSSRTLYSTRSIPVSDLPAAQISDAFALLHDMEARESMVCTCGPTLADVAEKAAFSTIDIKKKYSFS